MSLKNRFKKWLGITGLEADLTLISKDVIDLVKLKAELKQEIWRAFDEILREPPNYSDYFNYYARDLRSRLMQVLDRKIEEATNTAVVQIVNNECSKQLSSDTIVATIVDAINRRQLRTPLDK